MKFISCFLIIAFAVVIFLRTLQGMSINTNNPANIVQPTATNSSEATVVQALIKAYWDKDKVTLHRFLNRLLPMINREYHFETVDDLLTYLEERNITTATENQQKHRIINSKQMDLVNSHNATEGNTTDDISTSFRNSSSTNVDGSLTSTKRSHKYPLTSDEVININGKHKSTEKHRETAANREKIMQPHSLKTGVNTTFSENNLMNVQFINTETRNERKSKKPHTPSELDIENKVNSVKLEETATSVAFSTKHSVNNDTCDNKFSSSMKSNERATVCSPKEIIDVLRESLSSAIANISHSHSSPSTRLEHSPNTNATTPFSPRFIEDTFTQSTFSAILKELKVNSMNDSFEDLLPLSSPLKDNVDEAPTKKHYDKYKHSKDVATSKHGDHMNHTSLHLTQRNSSLHQRKQSTINESKDNSMNINNLENERNMSRIISIPSEEKSINHSSRTIENGSKDSSEIPLVSEHVSPDNTLGSVSSSSPRIEKFIVSPVRVGVEISQNKPMPNVSLVDLIVHSRKDSSPTLPSFPRGVPSYLSTPTTMEGASTHNESRARNISSVSLADNSSTQSSEPRKLAGDLVPIELEDTLEDKEREFTASMEIATIFLEDSSEELENNFDFNNRQDRATVANYTRNSSLIRLDKDDVMLKSGLEAGMTTTPSYSYFPEYEATLRGARAEDTRQGTLFTLRQGVSCGDDEPLRISFRQAEYKPSLFHFNTSSFRLDKQPHPLDAYIDEDDENVQESWEDPAIDLTCECKPGDTFDDWFSPSRPSEQNGCEDKVTRSNTREPGSDLNTVTSANFASGLGAPADKDYLNVTRRSSPAYTAWPSTWQPYYLPTSYYWQYYQNSWPSSNYVTYNVPPFFCPPCPQTCSEPPAKPRPSICPSCPQLFCAAQYSPPYPNQCPRPRPPRPPYCKNSYTPKVCPPCPKWCVSPRSPPRPQGCAPCPLLPQCYICSNCGSNIVPPIPYFCPFCNKPSYHTPRYNSCPNTNSAGFRNTYISKPSSSPVNEDGCELNYDISCPACPNECVYPNYPRRAPSCPPCPAKPLCNRPAPLPFCRPCPVDCVPDDYPARKYGCIPCQPLRKCSC